jgi:PBP1b-binding outer membrane lipoprotein LpoB
MKRLSVLALSLLLALLLSGCVTEGLRKQWREVVKDWNGENMEMGSHDHTSIK